MKRGFWMAALLSGAALLGFSPRYAGAEEPLTLRRALLSSGGVGYFEYEARASGDVDLPLEVRLDQVDDVLKSIVVYDDHGSVGEITLPAKTPEGEAFRDLPFDASALASEPALLGALQGAQVRVTVGGDAITGRVLSVTEETTSLPEGGGTTTRHRLALEASGSLRTVILEDTESVTFQDPALQAQLDAALAAELQHQDRGRRTLMIHSAGGPDRVVRVAYVVAVPLWKSTYRLTLPADPATRTAALQGWAVVENQSGASWKDVDLTLVSGNPVTFRQALYASYYVDRPEIPVEVVGRVLPRLEGGATTLARKASPALDHANAGAAGGWAGGPAPAFAAPMPYAPAAAATPALPVSTEAATQVIFHLAEPVTLDSGREALIPILARDIPATRVSLYQPDVNAENPLASVELTNDGDTGLPPGVLTIYERDEHGAVTYDGDARLATLPAGESRLASFGVDEKVRVDRRDEVAQTLTTATLADGVLRLTRVEGRTTAYTIAGAAREPRTVILEQPRLSGYDLTEPQRAGVETTDAFYRIRVEVPAGGTVTTKVVLSRPLMEVIGIADLSSPAIRAYATSSELPQAVRDALAGVATLRAAVDEKAAAQRALEADLAQITAEQARIRDNLKVVPAESALHQRYLTELGEQEDRIAAIQGRLSEARKAVTAAQEALANKISGLRIGAG